MRIGINFFFMLDDLSLSYNPSFAKSGRRQFHNSRKRGLRPRYHREEHDDNEATHGQFRGAPKR